MQPKITEVHNYDPTSSCHNFYLMAFLTVRIKRYPHLSSILQIKILMPKLQDAAPSLYSEICVFISASLLQILISPYPRYPPLKINSEYPSQLRLSRPCLCMAHRLPKSQRQTNFGLVFLHTRRAPAAAPIALPKTSKPELNFQSNASPSKPPDTRSTARRQWKMIAWWLPGHGRCGTCVSSPSPSLSSDFFLHFLRFFGGRRKFAAESGCHYAVRAETEGREKISVTDSGVMPATKVYVNRHHRTSYAEFEGGLFPSSSSTSSPEFSGAS